MSTREQWKRHTEEVLGELGIAEGHFVLDCCCGSGIYTAAAATLVGEAGLVYAIDKNNEKLSELRKKADSNGLQNIKIMERDVELKIPLPDSAVDFVLLYDIFWYFRPQENKMENLLKEVQRVAKPDALISVYPTHVDSNKLEQFKNEMKNNGFVLVSEYSRQLVHEENLERGKLLNYRKEKNYQIKMLEEKITDLKNRLPIHSVPPSMIQELEELEDELERIKREKKE
jgi:ubiquinone/menaquinone biosynthesis C-methylase UbiE